MIRLKICVGNPGWHFRQASARARESARPGVGKIPSEAGCSFRLSRRAKHGMLAPMQHPALETRQIDDGEFETRDQFNAVILYDRAAAGRRALSQLRHVTELLVEGLELQIRLWRLDVLGEDTADTTAAEDLAAADLLVLALDDDGSLNDRARERLQGAVYQLRGQGATVAILTGGTAAHAPSQFTFLLDFAKEAGVGFLFPPADQGPAGTKLAFTTHPHRAPAPPPMLA